MNREGQNVGHAEQVVQESPKVVVKIETIPAPNGCGELVAVRDGYRVDHLTGRTEGCRAHTFDDLERFARWLTVHVFERAEQVETLVDLHEVKTVVDPKHPDPEVLTCTLKADPTFEAWVKCFGESLSQQQFHNLARGFRNALGNPEELLAALRVMAVAQGGTLNSEIDEMGYTRLHATKGTSDLTAKLPPELTLTCPIYQGIKGPTGDTLTYPLEVLIFVSIESGTPVFQLACPRLEIARTDARRDVVAMLEHELESSAADFLVCLGELGVYQRNVYTPTGAGD